MGRFADRVAQGGVIPFEQSRCPVAGVLNALPPDQERDLLKALALPFRAYPHTVCAKDMTAEFYQEEGEPGPLAQPINYHAVSRHRNKTCSCIRYYPHFYEVPS